MEERTIRRQEAKRVKCFKYGEEEHKCRKCLLWKKVKRKGVERVVCVAMPQKAQQQKLRRVKEERAAHVAKPQKAQ